MSLLEILALWIAGNVLVVVVLGAVAVRELRYARRHEAERERHYASCDAYALAPPTDESEAARSLGYTPRPSHPWAKRYSLNQARAPEVLMPEGACREQMFDDGDSTG